jgi:tetratricopeptide (TPR) repeat protein
VTAGQHLAWRPSNADPPPPGPAPACAPELRTAEEANTWLGTERANLHGCAGYAAAHGHLVHAVRIPGAMSGFLHTQGHWTEAVTLGQAALAAARTAGDRHGQAWALHDLGELLLLSSAYRQARGYFTQALSIARDIDIPVEQARALEGIRRCRAQEGNPGQRAADP